MNEGAVVVERGVEAVMRDGTVLRADVYRPDAADAIPRPVLVNRTPYDKTHPRYVWIAEEMVRAGYIAVVQDIRGRWTSDGKWAWHRVVGHQQEYEDGYDTCEWAARLPGVDGQVGTWGNSYPSGCAWWMAMSQPPSLKAVFASGFPVSQQDSSRGILEIGQRLAWQHRMAVSPRQKDGDERWPRTVAEANRNWQLARGKWLWHLPLDTLPDELFGPTAPEFRQYMADIAAEPWESAGLHSRVTVPTCTLTGWWDRLNECAEHFTGMRARGPESTRGQHRLVIGPWVHDVEGEPDYLEPRGRGVEPHESHLAHLLAWYDHHLRGIDRGLDGEPPVKLFVVNDGWRHFDAWPPSGVVEQSWFLHSAGNAATARGAGSLDQVEPGGEPPDRFVYDPADPVMSLYDGQLVAVDQAPLADRRDVLVFRTAPLTTDVTVVGRPEARIWMASDQPDTDVFVRLIEEGDDGLAINVAQGVVRARYREGYDREVPLQAGIPTEFVVPLLATGFRFLKGSRIRVDVTSSDFPAFDRNHNTGRPYHSDPGLNVASQTLFHDRAHPSRIVLPTLTA